MVVGVISVNHLHFQWKKVFAPNPVNQAAER